MEHLTQDMIKQIVNYEPDKGTFIRNEHTRRVAKGSIVGTLKNNGYLVIAIKGKKIYLHRLAWFYMTGKWPERIDHINGIKTDNRWCNLREATRAQNGMNRTKQCNNTSGYKGVFWEKRRNKWRAQIDSKFIGYFDDPEDAYKMYCNYAKKLYGNYVKL